jgi:hypothetical protein
MDMLVEITEQLQLLDLYTLLSRLRKRELNIRNTCLTNLADIPLRKVSTSKHTFKASTYQEDINGSIWLWTNAPKLVPIGSMWGQSVLDSQLRRQVSEIDDIVLHSRSEARTLKSGTPNTLQKHMAHVNVHVLVVIDTLDKQFQKSDGGLVQLLTSIDGDKINHVPREFDEGADQALERTLRAILRERRLQRSARLIT